MTRKKKLSLYIKELERKRADIEIKLHYYRHPTEDNDIAFFSVKYLEQRLSDVERVINTLSTINENITK